MIASLRTLAAGAAALVAAAAATAQAPFAIRVVDAETGRGVPMIELRTTHDVRFVTDSNGIVAVDEPALRGHETFFHVRAHGYEHPADGFGYRGFRCVVAPGAAHEVQLARVNVAERLYRVTGAGIYRDSVLVGADVPIRAPLLNGGVTGQDSVVGAVYDGRIYWFWGDTNRLSYPLGNFAVSGATSRLPQDGALSPEHGVDLDYFVGEDGFARQMCPLPGPGPVWIFGLMVVPHDGGERMLAHYARMKDLGTRHEHGIVEWDPDTEQFVERREFPLETELHPSGNPTRVEHDGEAWFYFCNPYPTVRVRARREHILDHERYEALTLVDDEWTFAPGADVLKPGDARERAAAWMGLRCVETGERVRGHGGTVRWNAHRRKWVMIALQAGGRSFLGEVWYAEGDTPLGPWGYARRVVTHDDYSFYNVAQHPWFDEDGGRRIYFEGTYTATFSGSADRTPRYDYNQVMYGLDLDDPRLTLPEPAYEVDGERALLRGSQVTARGLWPKVRRVPFWVPRADGAPALLDVDDPRPDTAPVHEFVAPDGAARLRVADDPPAGDWRRLDPPRGRAFVAPAHRPPLLR